MERLSIPLLIAIAIFSLAWAGCNDDPDPTEGTATIAIDYSVGNDALVLDQINYTTLAGNSYSVTMMRYLLSSFVFHRTNGDDVQSDKVFYVEAGRPETANLQFDDIPFGEYGSVSFSLGLAPALNVPNGLPNEVDFNAMVWPAAMGGGYHFMRFEGHFIHSNTQQMGIAWHLGRDQAIMPFQLNHAFTLSEDDGQVGTLTMDIDQYFRNPVTFDLDTTNFSMGNIELIDIMVANGLDVFSIQ